MPEPIAFLETFKPELRSSYLEALRAAMPDELILPLDQLNEERRADVKIGIVAAASPAQISALPNLAWLHSLWAGVDRLVAQLASRPLPIVRPCDPEQTRRMGEAVLAWSLYLQRDMPSYAVQQSNKVWAQLAYRAPASMKIGLLGLGTMGAIASKRLREAGFGVAGWSRSPRELPEMESFSGKDGLTTLLRTSDITVCLLPLTSETSGMLDAVRFSQMKKDATFINFGRGEIVDEAALVDALDRKHLRHAVLDVFAAEPLSSTSPLWAHKSITVLPHISAPTDLSSMAQIIAANIRNYRSTGAIPHAVDLRRGY